MFVSVRVEGRKVEQEKEKKETQRETPEEIGVQKSIDFSTRTPPDKKRKNLKH